MKVFYYIYQCLNCSCLVQVTTDTGLEEINLILSIYNHNDIFTHIYAFLILIKSKGGGTIAGSFIKNVIIGKKLEYISWQNVCRYTSVATFSQGRMLFNILITKLITFLTITIIFFTCRQNIFNFLQRLPFDKRSYFCAPKVE